MLVQVQGNLIETDKIYFITKIIKGICYNPISRFDILFVNNNKTTISICSAQRIFDAKVKDHNERFKIINEDAEKLDILREKLINFWNSSQSPIPKLEL